MLGRINEYRRYIPGALLLIVIVALATAPAVVVYMQTKGNWHGVIPEYPKDATFYIARMAQVSRGYFFIGNPYIQEYREAPALSFFVADWLAAAPLLAGLSLTATIIFNNAFWSLLFGIFAYALFRKLGLNGWQSAVSSLLGFVQVYWLMLRPVAMQTVFPVYILFLLAFLLWFRAQDSRRRILLLACTSAITFYLYTFLWQIVCITFALTYMLFFVQRNWVSIRRLAIVNAISAVLALPFVVYSLKQIASPYYWETMMRVNLVYTRLPPIEAYYYCRWIVVALALGILLQVIAPPEYYARRGRELSVMMNITGLALLVASVSMVLLNKDVDTATHIGRFVLLWFSIVFCVLCARLTATVITGGGTKPWIRAGVVAVLVVVLAGYARNGVRAVAVSNISETGAVAIQGYAAPLSWLDQHVAAGSVIWVLNPAVATYVPILTHQYVLFHSNAESYLMPSAEVRERFLVSHYFDDISRSELERIATEYAGPGIRSQYQAHNRWVYVCNLFHLRLAGYSCGDLETEASFMGQQFFENVLSEYRNQTSPHINELLAKYHASYLLVDREHDVLRRPLSGIKHLALVYTDTRYDIYSINNPGK